MRRDPPLRKHGLDLAPELLARTMRSNVVVDLRNTMDAEKLEEHGVSVVGIGRRDISDTSAPQQTPDLSQAAE